MSTAKDLIIKPIDHASAKKIISLNHYSGKTTQNSQIHFGVFINDKLEGALQFGPSIDKRRMAQNLGIGFNDFLELNRMALSPRLPKNSESRALSICINIIKKKYPHIKIIVSFADGCQCGDGTIYRASGFKLHSFKKNTSLLRTADGKVVAKKSLDDLIDKKTGKYLSATTNADPLVGYQFKYIYFIDKELQKRITTIPFEKIPLSAKMYKGKKLCASSVESGTSVYQAEGSGESPTDALQLKET